MQCNEELARRARAAGQTGAILVATLFMEAEGGAPDEDNDDSCEPEEHALTWSEIVWLSEHKTM
eukprot:2885093-Amphidinium_carterae.1